MEPELLVRLHRDHARLAQILAAIELHAQRCEAGDRGTHLDLLASAVDYIVEYPDAVHHPVEDRIFDRLQSARLPAHEQEALTDNRDQHRQLRAATNKLAADIDALLRNSEGGVAALQRDVADFVRLQRAHMRNEEQNVFPMAERRLGASDWEELAQEVADTHDPLFDRRLGRYDSLYEYAVAGA